MSYASAKGKAMRQPPVKYQPPPLSDEEKAVVAERVQLVKAHLPGALDLIRALHAEGMVDGLRCIQSVTVFEGDEHGLGG